MTRYHKSKTNPRHFSRHGVVNILVEYRHIIYAYEILYGINHVFYVNLDIVIMSCIWNCSTLPAYDLMILTTYMSI